MTGNWISSDRLVRVTLDEWKQPLIFSLLPAGPRLRTVQRRGLSPSHVVS